MGYTLKISIIQPNLILVLKFRFLLLNMSWLVRFSSTWLKIKIFFQSIIFKKYTKVFRAWIYTSRNGR